MVFTFLFRGLYIPLILFIHCSYVFGESSDNTLKSFSSGCYSFVIKKPFATGNIILTLITTQPTCGYNNGNITASASNGNAPYQYSKDGITFQSNNNFSGLTEGTYTITAKDADGISTTASATLNDAIAPPSVMVSTNTDPTGCSGNDATITLIAAGGRPSYTFSMDGVNYQTGNTFKKLTAGNYFFFAKDANGCVAQLNYPLRSNCSLIAPGGYSIYVCKNEGYLQVSGSSGGVPPYQFSLDGSGFQTNGNFKNLASGIHTLNVKDATGLIYISAITILHSCIINVNILSSEATCGKKDGSISILASNGITPYLYSIDGINFQTTNLFSNLPGGNYTATVKDANGTSGSVKGIIVNSGCPSVTLVSTNALCGSNNGAITASGINGTPPYLYSIDGINFLRSGSFNGLQPGNYIIALKDAKGFSSAETVRISNVCTTVTAAVTDGTCDKNNGSIIAKGANGTAPYLYSIDGTNFQTDSSFTGLGEGTYAITIKDANGLSDTTRVHVGNSSGPQLHAKVTNASCLRQGGSITLIGTGGTTPFAYSINDSIFQTSNVFSNLTDSTYHLTLKDANGCTAMQDAIIKVSASAPLQVLAGNDTSIIINEPLQLNAIDIDNVGFSRFAWSPPLGLSNSYIKNPVAIIDKDITYNVTASTESGCQAFGTIHIKVYAGPGIFVPNAFTPNGDGHNDLLKPILVGIREFRFLVIYNRLGQQVFYTSSEGAGWNGKINGVLQNNSAFVWIASGIDYNGNSLQRKGTVVLIK